MNKNILIFDAAESVRHIDGNGFMHVTLTPISKACVNPYLGREIGDCKKLGLVPDRLYYGLRDPDELKKAGASFNGLPVLMNHHDTDAQNPVKEYTVGSTGTDATFDAPYLKNSLHITDAAAIAAIQDGTAREISCAYAFRPDFTPGEWDAGDGTKIHYDFIMRDIAGNHVALVPTGRAGHDVRVADALPSLKNNKRSDKQMSRREKLLAFKRARYGLAKDADLGIEAAEVAAAGFQKALNAIEAQVEGYDPREVGLEVDKAASVDDIIAKFLPDLDEEKKGKVKAALENLRGEVAADDEPTDPQNPLTDAPDDERFKNPDFKAGFEAGVKYGEERQKADPDKIAREHEHEGEEKYLTGDSIEKVRAQVADEMKKHFRELNAAAQKVKPLVGTINDPLAFDDAAEIYKFALKQSNKDVSKYPKEAYGGMVDILLDAKPAYPQAPAGGSKFSKKIDAAFDRLNEIN